MPSISRTQKRFSFAMPSLLLPALPRLYVHHAATVRPACLYPASKKSVTWPRDVTKVSMPSVASGKSCNAGGTFRFESPSAVVPFHFQRGSLR